MAIQQLDVQGYRSFEKICWRPGRLNLLVGPNGSGKSNLLRLLELIAETARGRLANSLKAGGIVPLLWDYQAPKVYWKLRIDPVDPGRDVNEDALTYKVELGHLQQTSSYQILNDSLGNWVNYERQLAPSPLWIFKRDLHQVIVYHTGQSRLVRLQDVDANESLLSQISDPSVNPIPTHTKRFLDGWRVYHDVHVERGSPMRLPATTQVAKWVEPDGSNLTPVLFTRYPTDRGFRRQIHDGMRAAFGSEFQEIRFEPAGVGQVQLGIQWQSSGRPHVGQDLSDGTLRFLMLLTVLASPDPATLIAIDEPEIGLHPSMLPIIAEYAAEAATRTQVVMTSHSPVFLDALSKARPDVTLLHWENGKSQLFPLDAEALERWLAEYRLGELFTSGDLEAIASPPVEEVPQLADRIKSLPPEDATMPGTD